MPEKNYTHEVINPKGMFDPRSFRTKEIKPGIKIVIGCPIGEWSPSKNVCKVGTKIQKILRKKIN